MKITLTEMDGLAQRFEMLRASESTEYANTSVSYTREPHKAVAVPQIAPRPTPPPEINQERQQKFSLIEQNTSALRALRAQRLKLLVDEAEAREKAEALERANKQREEEKRASERAQERERQLKQVQLEEEKRQAALKKAEEDRLAAEKKEQDKRDAERQAAEKAASERAEKARREQEEIKRVQEEKKTQEKLQAEQKAKQEKEEEEAAAAAKASTSTSASQGASDAASEYTQHMKVIQNAKDLNTQLSTNKELKKRCFDFKIKIKSKLGQLTPSRSHLLESVKQINEVFDEARKTGDLGYAWVMNQYSKIVVQQAERESRVDGSSAVPIAMLTTLVWAAHPELGQYLVARFVKKNPYVIGFQCPIDTEQGRKRMGYRRDDGQWEGDAAYAERIGGITSVWAVITQSKISPKSGQEHPYPITHSWIFIARQLNIPVDKLYNANFAALAAWWDVAGSRFLDAYGKQGVKLLELACTGWPAVVDSQTFAAAKRLKLLGQDWKRQGKIEPVWKPLGP